MYNLSEVKERINSSLNYLPKSFLNIDTSTLGNSYFKEKDEENNKSIHPFFQLKEKAMDITININDRMQAIRFMISIPMKNNIEHTIEAIKTIQTCNQIDIYKRFNFWSTQDPLFKLDDTVIHTLHPWFFSEGLKNEYPLDLILLSCGYILNKYGREYEFRQDVLDYLVDLCEDKYAGIRQKLSSAEILVKNGEFDEQKYGKQIINKYNNLLSKDSTNVKDWYQIELSSIKKLRYLVLSINEPTDIHQKIYSINNLKTKCLHSLQLQNNETNDSSKYILFNQNWNQVLNETNENFRFENMSFTTILYYISSYIKDLKEEEFDINYFIESILLYKDWSDNYNFCIFILQTLKQVKEVENNLRISLEDELRQTIFNRYNSILYSLSQDQKDSVIKSIESDNLEDKMDVEQFLDYYSIENEIFKKYSNEISLDEFNQYYNKIINEYKRI